MKAIYKDQLVEFWKISDDKPDEDWVIQAFEQRFIAWDRLPDGQLKFLAVGKNQLPELGVFTVFGAGTMGGVFNMAGVTIGQMDDYLIFDGKEYTAIRKRKFEKRWTILGES